jgi:hypothetical protein
MKIEIPEDLVIAGVAAAAEELLTSERLVDRIADAIVARFELLTPEVAAAILEVTPRTLRDQAVQWGLDKSTAFGATNPRYFLSQILERAREKKLKGRALLKAA